MLVHAVIGCGRVAPNHVYGFERLNESRVKWLCDLDISKAQALTHLTKSAHITTNYLEILRDPEVHSVSVIVDHGHHYAVARDVLAAKKHLLLEKPIALSVEHGHELISLAISHGLKFTVVSQHRFDPLIQYIKALTERQGFGKISSVQASLSCGRSVEYYTDSYWRGTWELEGGSVLINQAYHLWDIIRWLVGEVSSVEAIITRQTYSNIIETEDTGVAVLQFASGALGTVNVTGATSVQWRSRIDLTGLNGSLSFDLDNPNHVHQYDLPRVEEILLRATIKKSSHDHKEMQSPGQSYYGVSHLYQIEDFVHSILNQHSCFVQPDDSLETLKLIHSVYRQAEYRGKNK